MHGFILESALILLLVPDSFALDCTRGVVIKTLLGCDPKKNEAHQRTEKKKKSFALRSGLLLLAK